LEQHNVYLRQNEASSGSSLGERIREIGMNDEVPFRIPNETPLSGHQTSDLPIEPSGTKVPEDEAKTLANLLQRGLDYTPKERSPADVIVKHRWFTLGF